jgi:hypothetical protein
MGGRFKMEMKIVGGNYQGFIITNVGDTIESRFKHKVEGVKLYLNKDTIEHYEIMDETSVKSAKSVVGRAFVGGALLGPIGLLAGITGKTNRTIIVALQHNGGKQSLLEFDSEGYQHFLKATVSTPLNEAQSKQGKLSKLLFGKKA